MSAAANTHPVFERMGDRELLLYLARKIEMATIDLTAVNSAITQLTTDVQALIAADTGDAGVAAAAATAQLQADQAALGPVGVAIANLDAQVQAALTATGPTGTTGSTGASGPTGS